MAHYVDGFVIALPKRNLAAYRRMAVRANRIWKQHGALAYKECVGDDLKGIEGVSAFPRLARLKRGETVLFSWIVFKSRAHRDKVNASVMKDPRIKAMCGADGMPFEPRRMAYGGFKTIVES